MISMTETKFTGFLRPFAISICGIAALTVSSWVSVPMYPVPTTLQTAVILLIGALCGPRFGAGIVLAWLGLAFAGAPLLSDGSGTPAAFVGPTAGYLASFPIAAFLAGLVTRQKSFLGIGIRTAAFIGLHAIILGMGFTWLSTLVGVSAAWIGGVAPFFLGAALKSGLAAALVSALPSLRLK